MVMFGSAFQGSPFIEILSAAGKDPLAGCKLQGLRSKRVFEQSTKGYIFNVEGGANARLHIPKDPKKTLGLTQHEILGFQIFIPQGADCNVDIAVTDSAGARKWVLLLSHQKAATISTMHARLPFGMVTRGKWVNCLVDVNDLVLGSFKSVSLRSMDTISFSATCKVRKVFILKSMPNVGVVSDSRNLPSKALHFPVGVTNVTNVICFAVVTGQESASDLEAVKIRLEAEQPPRMIRTSTGTHSAAYEKMMAERGEGSGKISTRAASESMIAKQNVVAPPSEDRKNRRSGRASLYCRTQTRREEQAGNGRPEMVKFHSMPANPNENRSRIPRWSFSGSRNSVAPPLSDMLEEPASSDHDESSPSSSAGSQQLRRSRNSSSSSSRQNSGRVSHTHSANSNTGVFQEATAAFTFDSRPHLIGQGGMRDTSPETRHVRGESGNIDWHTSGVDFVNRPVSVHNIPEYEGKLTPDTASEPQVTFLKGSEEQMATDSIEQLNDGPQSLQNMQNLTLKHNALQRGLQRHNEDYDSGNVHRGELGELDEDPRLYLRNSPKAHITADDRHEEMERDEMMSPPLILPGAGRQSSSSEASSPSPEHQDRASTTPAPLQVIEEHSYNSGGAWKSQIARLDSDSPIEDDGGEELDLLYDPVLNCYYDPVSNKYYDLL
eukprot:Clim_evm80s142 gene=Clim_evmTU80s142